MNKVWYEKYISFVNHVMGCILGEPKLQAHSTQITKRHILKISEYNWSCKERYHSPIHSPKQSLISTPKIIAIKFPDILHNKIKYKKKKAETILKHKIFLLSWAKPLPKPLTFQCFCSISPQSFKSKPSLPSFFSFNGFSPPKATHFITPYTQTHLFHHNMDPLLHSHPPFSPQNPSKQQ